MLLAARTRRDPLGAVVAWVFACPVWLLSAMVLVGSTVLFGYERSGAIGETVRMAVDPFHQDLSVGPWRYSSPLTPLLAWAFHAPTFAGVALVDYVMNAALIVGCAYGVRAWVSEYAARLFLLAYFCSPNAWAGTAGLGVIDTPTLAGLTVCMVAPPGWCLAAGILLGFNHFEQAGIALVAVAVIRVVMRRDTWTPIVAGFGGLLVGKMVLLWYLVLSGIDTNGRLEFIRDQGMRDIVGGSAPHLGVLLFAVYNVLWVGVIWMLSDMDRRTRWIVIGLQMMLTVPVLITYDLSRVYRTVTWPIVVLLVVYAAEHADRRLVQRVAVLLAVAACFVPRTEIWHGGLVIN